VVDPNGINISINSYHGTHPFYQSSCYPITSNILLLLFCYNNFINYKNINDNSIDVDCELLLFVKQ